MKNKFSLFKGLYFTVAVLFGLAALSFITTNQSNDFSESENQTKTTIENSKNPIINDKSHTISPKKVQIKETLQSAKKRKDTDLLEKENSDPLLKSEGSLKTDSIVEGVGLSEKELRALHANQRREIEQMYRNMESIVIAPDEELTIAYILLSMSK